MITYLKFVEFTQPFDYYFQLYLMPFLDVKHLTTEDDLPPVQGMRIIIASIFALQPCMLGNEIGLIRSFSTLICKTRLSLQSVKTGQM